MGNCTRDRFLSLLRQIWKCIPYFLGFTEVLGYCNPDQTTFRGRVVRNRCIGENSQIVTVYHFNWMTIHLLNIGHIYFWSHYQILCINSFWTRIVVKLWIRDIYPIMSRGRGCRQGEPLSQYLSIVFSELFAFAIKRD